MKPEDFLKKVDGKIKIFFHVDADGASSAAIVLAYLKQRKKNAELVCTNYEALNLRDDRSDFFIFVDLNIDQFKQIFEGIDPKKIIIIDHHPIFNDLNEMGIIHINPRLKDPDKYVSASMVVFDICKKAGLKGFDWLWRIGAEGDRAIEGTEEDKEAAKIIASVRAIKGHEALIQVAKFLSECKKIDDFLYSDFSKHVEKLDRELENQIRKFESEGVKDVSFFELKSNYSLMGALSNRMFDMYPEKTIIIYKKTDGYIQVSGRSKKYNIGNLFKVAAKDIGTGGGHPVAGGAKVKEKDFNKFKKRFLEEIK
jgi:single-stranded DNA-specific DHH superfamily exonuclease